MPAPTALLRRPEELAESVQAPAPEEEEHPPPHILLSPSSTTQPADSDSLPSQDVEMQDDDHNRPRFRPARNLNTAHTAEARKILIPPHRMSPLKAAWPKIYPPLVEHLKLQVRMNLKAKAIEIRTSNYTTNPAAIQQSEDFLKAFSFGFDVDDAIALLRLDDLYIETFEIKDVKSLNGDHLSRAIGRISGRSGKVKFAIENASRTRIVLADQKIHILGGFRNIHIAREAIVSLILGSPPGKVYGNMRTVASRMKERF